MRISHFSIFTSAPHSAIVATAMKTPPTKRVKRDVPTPSDLFARYEQQLLVMAEAQNKFIALTRSPRNDSTSAKEYAETIDLARRTLFEIEDRIKGVRPGSVASIDDVAVQIQARVNAIDQTIAKP